MFRGFLLLIGTVAGLVVITAVARHGYVTSDSEFDGTLMAFYNALVALWHLSAPQLR